eukprot:1158230-Pelagomonas_calceolata.AAC.10
MRPTGNSPGLPCSIVCASKNQHRSVTAVFAPLLEKGPVVSETAQGGIAYRPKSLLSASSAPYSAPMTVGIRQAARLTQPSGNEAGCKEFH